jgi:hypothetical protein
MLVYRNQFNVRPDNYDSRDLRFKFAKTKLSPVVDLRPYASPVEDSTTSRKLHRTSNCGRLRVDVKQIIP